MRNVYVIAIVLGLLVPSFSHAQQTTPDLNLHPNGFGPHAYAAWKAKQGQEDSEGEGDHSLYFQKLTATETVAAGIAVITGFKKQLPIAASSLTGLSWEHRNDGWCGAGAPRWNVIVTGASGTRYTLFLGCAAAAHSPGSAAGWTRDSYAAPTLLTIGATNAGQMANIMDIQAGTLTGLSIVFDEGTTFRDAPLGPGFVHLDNITVSINGMPKVWTGPMDNGR
jgi:hypothetical protein